MPGQVIGKIYDIQGFSVQDGPGIRTTVFLKGCPLCCPWCHSPESQQFHSQLAWIAMRCAGLDTCPYCLQACTLRAISPGNAIPDPETGHPIRHIQIDRSACDNCGACAAACTRNALYMCGVDHTVDEVLDRVLKDKPFYEQSGGGVTISGGEPMAQPEFVMNLLERLKANRIHTALDTTGHVPYEILKQSIPFTDLYLYDLKHMDNDRHKTATGVSNDLILENSLKLAAAGCKMQIRIPVIPDFNDSETNMKETGNFCKSLESAVTLIQLLPYHNLGAMKYQRIDNRTIVFETDPPSEAKLMHLQQILERFGLRVTIH
ncbi:MAG: glycyl-radical enzyme activating protein [Acidobacteriota bacterium]